MTESDDKTSIPRFIESLKDDKQFEINRPLIRVMPKGLFVDERIAEVVVANYQSWLSKQTDGVAAKSIEKCKQRLFDGDSPERFYLNEGKTVLAGYLVSAAISAPRQFNLPYYLGSLLSTKEYIHPADSAFQEIRGVTVRQGKQGVEAVVSRGDRNITIPQQVARQFLEQAHGSRLLQKIYPGIDSSMSVAMRALISMARRSRGVPKSFPMIVPRQAKSGKSVGVRISGRFLLIDDRGELKRVIELGGRNLSMFLRDELQGAPREKLGSFRPMTKHRDLLGYYELSGRRTTVHARAFSEFVTYVMRAKDPRERFTGWFTAVDAFERFSSFFQLAQPIDRKKIASAVDHLHIEGATYRVYGGWIFSLSREGTVMRCVAKHIRLSGQRRERPKRQ